MKAERIEILLSNQATPAPPDGLAETIKKQIPNNISSRLTLVPDLNTPTKRRQHWFAAAAVITVILTGAVTWQLRQGPVNDRAGVKDDFLVKVAEIEETAASETGSVVEPTAVAQPAELRALGYLHGNEAERSKRIAPPVHRAPEAEASPVFAGEVMVTADFVPRPNLESVSSYVVFDQEIVQQPQSVPASTGGTSEPNDQPYPDVFFNGYGVNPFIDTEDDHLSTFGLDVDTGSYTVTRRYIRDGNLPPREAIRIEEFVNYFDYGDRGPSERDFELKAEGAPTPFAENKRYKLLRFAINAREVDRDERPSAVLTFVVDVSGSMDRENRLGLVKKSLYELLDNLRSDDRVGLVIYGSRGEVLLRPTDDHEEIRTAIGNLRAGGSTNAEEGLVLAYELAADSLERDSINRIILCSDGVANVGRTGSDPILERIRRDAERGIELTTVGFGMGNYNDELMEQLADAGNGRYAYVDALPEARRLFVEELTGTLLTIGHDAKAQVEFNPKVVERYRLIGYENRDVADDRFRDPTVDAGEIGAGHSVTALYEVKLKRWAKGRAILATLRVRYRPMGEFEPVEIEQRLKVRDLARSWEKASRALRLAGLVAEYAEILKGSYWAREGDLNRVLRLTQELTPEFADDTRFSDFTSLVAAAAELKQPPAKISTGNE